MNRITIESNGNINIDGDITNEMRSKLLQALAGHSTVIINLHMSEDGGLENPMALEEGAFIFNNTLTGNLGDDFMHHMKQYRLYLTPNMENKK